MLGKLPASCPGAEGLVGKHLYTKAWLYRQMTEKFKA
jgi:hypothetical protein